MRACRHNVAAISLCVDFGSPVEVTLDGLGPKMQRAARRSRQPLQFPHVNAALRNPLLIQALPLNPQDSRVEILNGGRICHSREWSLEWLAFDSASLRLPMPRDPQWFHPRCCNTAP